ncbi:hypothetical protein [Anthocerotibacter panamensis]|uniref:hypothetical protein n=1 Tax=Anthocerotibacter panamensis TaxID=2857077 RepID=UPI001C402632|nr:hypothetical protein [Anthocerotibacter panamensis]
MQIPTCFYGRYSEVKSRCKKAVMALKRGKTWEEAVGTSDVLDTVSTPGFLVLDNPGSGLGSELNFHIYPLLPLIRSAIVGERLSPEIEDKVFSDSLQTAWGILGLISRTNTRWVTPPERYQPFLQAALRFWDELYLEGKRYTTGSNSGKDLWATPNNLHYVLANMDMPEELLDIPLPMGGIETLLSYIKS